MPEGREAANAGTIGTAADWIMRFLVHLSPSLRLAAKGALLCGMLPPLKDLAFLLGFRGGGMELFSGSARSIGAETDQRYRVCWRC